MLELAVCPWVFSHFFCLAILYVLLCVERYAWFILQDRVLQDRVKAAFPLERGHHSIPDQMWFPYVMRITQIHRLFFDTVRRVGMCPHRSDLPLLSKRFRAGLLDDLQTGWAQNWTWTTQKNWSIISQKHVTQTNPWHWKHIRVKYSKVFWKMCLGDVAWLRDFVCFLFGIFA